MAGGSAAVYAFIAPLTPPVVVARPPCPTASIRTFVEPLQLVCLLEFSFTSGRCHLPSTFRFPLCGKLVVQQAPNRRSPCRAYYRVGSNERGRNISREAGCKEGVCGRRGYELVQDHRRSTHLREHLSQVPGLAVIRVVGSGV